MSKLNVDQKRIKELLSENHANFLIPDYQRPYAWEEEECQTLWDDIFVFAFPNNNKDDFNIDDEYFLGSIVTYKNDNRQSEIIDGQQRLTTIMLLLRAFYDRFESMKDKESQDVRKNISQCLWKTDEFGNADSDNLKIDSEVATDDEKDEFLGILKNGIETTFKSKYAENYRFFERKIDDFINEYASYLKYLPARILNNCILLPIEADSQDTALRIFSTLNDRGLPLADADIFKAQFYKYYQNRNEKEKFIDDWKEISKTGDSIYKKPMSVDELFTKYMYLIRAKEGIKTSTTEALRKFFEHNNYQRLLKANTIDDLKKLVYFWKSIYELDEKKFNEDVLKRLYVLKFAPNSMWEYLTSVYFFINKDNNYNLDNNLFSKFLSKITAFIFAYAITNPGVNALRTPAYEEMIKISKKEPIDFVNFKFDEIRLRNSLKNYKFTNSKTVTRSIITWYAFTFKEQNLPKNEDFQIEHIYAKKRQEIEHDLSNKNNLEELGNKILLERTINIRAADYKFTDKKHHYNGFTNNKGKKIKGSSVAEIKQLVKLDDFTEKDIENRDKKIHDTFIDFLHKEDLLE
ncbi:MAG: DUF262 domain-containing protein [Methanobrevibacter sp.]|jgi:uncharacterized protein with ParB-like and HNH nuclease domain|nr:DUF262 domain-containing protein [Candidatus Methanovirga australis]